MDLIKNRQVKYRKYISLLICALLVFSIFANSVESHAIIPALIAADGVITYGGSIVMLLAAGGLAGWGFDTLSNAYNVFYENMPSTLDAYFQNNYQSWINNGEIVISKEMFELMSDRLDSLMTNNTLMLEMLAGNIVPYSVGGSNGFQILCVYPTSSISYSNVAFFNLLNFYQVGSEDYLYVTPKVRYFQNIEPDLSKMEPSLQLLDSSSAISFTHGLDGGQARFSTVFPAYIGLTCDISSNMFCSYAIGKLSTTGADYETLRVVNSTSTGASALSELKAEINSFLANYVSEQPIITYNIYNPTYNADGNAVIPFPSGLTWDDIYGKSGADIFNPNYDIPVDPSLPGTGEYHGVLGSIKGLLNGLWDGVLSGVGTITGAISAAVSTIIASLADLTEPFKWQKPGGPIGGLFAFFNPLLALLIAIMALIAKILIFLGQLYNIPSSSAMLHPTMIQGINWARGLNSAGGVNLYGLVTGVISIVLGIVVFKLIRNMIAGIGSASPFKDSGWTGTPSGWERRGPE